MSDLPIPTSPTGFLDFKPFKEDGKRFVRCTSCRKITPHKNPWRSEWDGVLHKDEFTHCVYCNAPLTEAE